MTKPIATDMQEMSNDQIFDRLSHLLEWISDKDGRERAFSLLQALQSRLNDEGIRHD